MKKAKNKGKYYYTFSNYSSMFPSLCCPHEDSNNYPSRVPLSVVCEVLAPEKDLAIPYHFSFWVIHDFLFPDLAILSWAWRDCVNANVTLLNMIGISGSFWIPWKLINLVKGMLAFWCYKCSSDWLWESIESQSKFKTLHFIPSNVDTVTLGENTTNQNTKNSRSHHLPCSLVLPKQCLPIHSSTTCNLPKGNLLRMLLLEQREPHEEVPLCSLDLRYHSYTWGCV